MTTIFNIAPCILQDVVYIEGKGEQGNVWEQ